MEVYNIKNITFQLRIPVNGIGKNKEFTVNVRDNAILAEALAMVDKYIFEHPEKSHFVNHKHNAFIRCYLQLFWNPEENSIYSDIDLFAASAKGMMPLQKKIDFNLYDNSEISLTSNS